MDQLPAEVSRRIEWFQYGLDCMAIVHLFLSNLLYGTELLVDAVGPICALAMLFITLVVMSEYPSMIQARNVLLQAIIIAIASTMVFYVCLYTRDMIKVMLP